MAIDNTPMLVPHLVVDGAAAALDFYAKAFGAEEMTRLPGPGGKLMHAAFRINGHMVFVNDDFPEFCDGRSSAPTALGGTPVTVHLHGPDVDGRFQRAVDAGATVFPPCRQGDAYEATPGVN